jgi:VCBS repeat-containing protein
MAVTTSLSNTPQAGDDIYSWTEDQLAAIGLPGGNILTLDVMSNDLGGKAKKLFSLDDGNGHASATDYDLLQADLSGVYEAIATGDRVRIVNGQVQLDLSASLLALGATDISALAAGDHIHDEFVYAIQLGNGTLSQAMVTVDIWGQNDVATIAPSTHEDTSVTEAGGAHNAIAGDPRASGQLTVADADHGQSGFRSVAATALVGAYGNFTLDSTTGAWSFTLDQAKADPLVAGQHVTDTLTVTSLDGTASQTITVDIAGSNDAPVLQSAVGTDPVFGEDSLTLSAAMAFSDVDLTDTHSVTVTALGSGYIGDFTPTIATETTGGHLGSVALTYHLTMQQFEQAGGQFPDHQDYRVTIDDHHGGTSSQVVSIPLAQILNDVGGGDGGGSPTVAPPVFINTSPPLPFLVGRNLGQVIDNPFVLHPSFIPPGGFSTDLFTQGTLQFTDADGGHHQASVDPSHARLVGYSVHGLAQSVTSAPISSLPGTWQLDVHDDTNQVHWGYTLNETAVRSLSGGEFETFIVPVTVFEDGVGQSTTNVRIDLIGADEPTSLVTPGSAFTATTNITPYLQPIDLATHVQTQNFSITEDPLVTGSASRHQVSGTIYFVDPDRLDHPTVTMAVADMTHSLDLNPGDGPFNAAVQPLMAGFSYTVESFGNYGMIHWTYDVQDSALDFLAQVSTSTPGNAIQGTIQTASATFNIGATPGGPGGGGSLSTVNVNLYGSNDAVVIAGSNTTLVDVALHGRASGSFTITDPDWYPDSHNVIFVPHDPSTHGYIFGGTPVEAGVGGSEPISWNYTADFGPGTLIVGQHDIWDVVVQDQFGSSATHTLDFHLV